MDLGDGAAGVEDFIGEVAGQRAADDVARGVAAGELGDQADSLEAGENVGGVLDGEPVELDVLAGGDVAEAAGVLLGDEGDFAELRGGEEAVGDADAEHEVAIAVGLLLIEAEPAEADEVLIGDGGEAFFRITGDIIPDGEAVLLAFEGFDFVEFFAGFGGDGALLCAHGLMAPSVQGVIVY